MLTELCQEIKNWFVLKKVSGTFTIQDGGINASFLATGQYYRIIGSIFNDGVHKYPSDDLTDETFDGAIWCMAVPKEVVELADQIQKWKEKYGGFDSALMSPFSSESFGGYSYTKGSNFSSVTQANSASGWKAAYASELNRWRKI